MRRHCLVALLASACLANIALADTTVQMYEVTAEGKAEALGTVTISESTYGLVFSPQLKGLDPGVHGFHVHENPSCDPGEKDGKPVAAGSAGEHFDPEKTGKHGFPWGAGHLGDLPTMYVNGNGNATNPVLAPRIKKLSDVSDRALMVHMGGDNHSDSPKPSGGGGTRIACGVISQSQ
jgi:Cu-Zn family superoxide dismutase